MKTWIYAAPAVKGLKNGTVNLDFGGANGYAFVIKMFLSTHKKATTPHVISIVMTYTWWTWTQSHLSIDMLVALNQY